MFRIFIMICLFSLSSMVYAEQPNSRTVTETFDDWELICVEADNNKRCEAKQTLINQDKQVVAVITVAEKDNDQQYLQLALPHLLDLTKPVKIAVDGGSAKDFAYNFCNNIACFVIIEDEKLLSEFSKGTAGVISVSPIGAENNLNLNFSLKGFSATLNRLKSI